jgi:hypothetical protein
MTRFNPHAERSNRGTQDRARGLEGPADVTKESRSANHITILHRLFKHTVCSRSSDAIELTPEQGHNLIEYHPLMLIEGMKRALRGSSHSARKFWFASEEIRDKGVRTVDTTKIFEAVFEYRSEEEFIPNGLPRADDLFARAQKGLNRAFFHSVGPHVTIVRYT